MADYVKQALFALPIPCYDCRLPHRGQSRRRLSRVGHSRDVYSYFCFSRALVFSPPTETVHQHCVFLWQIDVFLHSSQRAKSHVLISRRAAKVKEKRRDKRKRKRIS